MLMWSFVMGLCGWTAGRIVGGKGLGAVADILLGITGAMAVRFVLEASSVAVQDINALLFSVWGAAGLAGLIRVVMRYHDRDDARLNLAAYSRTKRPDQKETF